MHGDIHYGGVLRDIGPEGFDEKHNAMEGDQDDKDE